MSHPLRAEAPSVAICARLSPEERARVEAATRLMRQTVSEFTRDALMTRADDCLDSPPVANRNTEHVI